MSDASIRSLSSSVSHSHLSSQNSSSQKDRVIKIIFLVIAILFVAAAAMTFADQGSSLLPHIFLVAKSKILLGSVFTAIGLASFALFYVLHCYKNSPAPDQVQTPSTLVASPTLLPQPANVQKAAYEITHTGFEEDHVFTKETEESVILGIGKKIGHVMEKGFIERFRSFSDMTGQERFVASCISAETISSISKENTIEGIVYFEKKTRTLHWTSNLLEKVNSLNLPNRCICLCTKEGNSEVVFTSEEHIPEASILYIKNTADRFLKCTLP